MIYSLVPYINLFSRITLLGASSYRAVKTRESGWILLSFAFLLSTLDVEEYILKPLGIQIQGNHYLFTFLPSFYIGILFLMTTFLLREHQISPRGVIIIGSTFIIFHIWTFAMAVNLFNNDFTLIGLLPSLILGGSLIFLSVSLLEYVNRKSIEILFPIGVGSVGLLNLTYPVTRNIHTISDMLFLVAAIFRLIAAIGEIKMVTFVPKAPKNIKVISKPGAYWTENEEKGLNLISTMNPVIITRKRDLNIKTPAIVYWITKVKEGEIGENIYAILPTNIGILTDLIYRAFKVGYNAVYIDCIEYLILENGTKATLKFLYNAKDIVLSNKGTIVLVINPKALGEQELKIIEKEFQKI